ncbi:MAG TPA: DUF6629 family protein, partial [Acidimicrobiales bacterium]|nr:DUF6629 family protein [Acidimicrobiales bacterium]
MCFSAEADLAAGMVVGAVAVDALRHVKERRQLAIASLPGLFALHQLTEAFVWWGLGGEVPWPMGRVAVFLYLIVALGVLPVLVPLAVLAIEPSPRRRALLSKLGACGVAVATLYLAAMALEPVVAKIEGNHVAYYVEVVRPQLVATVYVLAGCGALLVSSHRAIVAFGLANAGAVAVLLWIQANALTSLWCLWAAIASVAVAAHLRRSHRSPSTDPTLRPERRLRVGLPRFG